MFVNEEKFRKKEINIADEPWVTKTLSAIRDAALIDVVNVYGNDNFTIHFKKKKANIKRKKTP